MLYRSMTFDRSVGCFRVVTVAGFVFDVAHLLLFCHIFAEACIKFTLSSDIEVSKKKTVVLMCCFVIFRFVG